jgi:hypothetical protein
MKANLSKFPSQPQDWPPEQATDKILATFRATILTDFSFGDHHDFFSVLSLPKEPDSSGVMEIPE